jgi:RNA polymerase sigma factor (sigma-70 family)
MHDSHKSSKALEAMLTQHLDLVYSIALRQVRDPHLAEDVTQNVFLIAAKKASSIPPQRAAAWLVKATRYAALASLRSQRRKLEHERRAAVHESSDQPGQADDLAPHLDHAIASLGEADREAIVLRFYLNYSIQQVAQTLLIAENTASKRLERALKKLRGYLHRRGVRFSTDALASVGLLGSAPAHLRHQVLAAIKSGAVPAGGSSVLMGVLLMTNMAKLQAGLLALLVAFLAIGSSIWLASPTPVPQANTPTSLPPVRTIVQNAPGTTTLSGVVRDAAGKPMAGVLVTQGYGPDMSDSYFTTRTDSQGQFSIANVTLGRQLALAALAPGYAPELFEGVVTPDAGSFAFSMTPASLLRVRFVDARGNPIRNLPLEPTNWRHTEVLRIYSMRGGWNGPMTDADGVMTWNGAPADAVLFDPIAPKHFLRKNFTLTASTELQTVTIPDAIAVKLIVRDAETDAPLPEFSVIHGFGDRPVAADYWDEQRKTTGNNGEYATVISWSRPHHFYRIEAAGYQPTIQGLDESSPTVELTYRMRKGAGPTISIVGAGGDPAAGAEVFLMNASNQRFQLQQSQLLFDPRWPTSRDFPARRSDAAGKLLLPEGEDPAARMVIVHEDGYADVPLNEAMKAPVQLSAWASIEGIAKVGSRPAAGRTVHAYSMMNHPGNLAISSAFDAQADAEGHFVIPRVPPGAVRVGMWVQVNHGSRFATGTTTHATSVAAAPGLTAHVTIGGDGRPVIGRIVGADGKPIAGAVYGMGELASGRENPPQVPASLMEKFRALESMPKAQAEAASKELMAGEEYLAYLKQRNEWQRKIRTLAFPSQSDGSFQADDVSEGKYQLSIQVWDGSTAQPIGFARATVEVPPVAPSAIDDPIDLGALTLQPPPAEAAR